MKFVEFSKKIEDIGLDCSKLEMMFHESDSRLWTAIVDPSKLNLLVTFHVNREHYRHRSYDVQTPNRIISNVDLDKVFKIIEDINIK